MLILLFTVIFRNNILKKIISKKLNRNKIKALEISKNVKKYILTSNYGLKKCKTFSLLFFKNM
jgi:hypothetical protein